MDTEKPKTLIEDLDELYHANKRVNEIRANINSKCINLLTCDGHVSIVNTFESDPLFDRAENFANVISERDYPTSKKEIARFCKYLQMNEGDTGLLVALGATDAQMEAYYSYERLVDSDYH